jgi:FMN-dependent NADH-azoreductase
MQILHISCSPRGQASESYRLSRRIVAFLLVSEPTAKIVNRAIGDGGMSHIDGDYAAALSTTREPSATVSQTASFSDSEELIRELESSDFVVIGTPMHNFTVPSTLKAWIDHIVRVRRTFDSTKEGKQGKLSDRPIFVAVSSGAKYSGERARQPDFLTPYLKAILGTIGLHDLTFFSVEGTSSGPGAVVEARASADRALQKFFHHFPGGSLNENGVGSLQLTTVAAPAELTVSATSAATVAGS